MSRGDRHERDWKSQKLGAGNRKTITVIGFGHRLAAILLDSVLLGFLSMIVGLVIGMLLVFLDMYTPNRPLPFDWYVVGCMLVFSVIYYVAGWARSVQTIGKTAVGIKTVGADGKPPSGGKALLRYAGYIVSGIVLALGFWWVVFDRKRQGWHDKIAGAYVVYMDAEFSDADAVRLVPSDPKPDWIWVVLWVVLAVGLPLGAVTAV